MNGNGRLFMSSFGLVGITGIALSVLGGAADRRVRMVEAGSAAEPKPEDACGPPPLVIDTDVPLLLDQPIAPDRSSARAATAAAASNGACYVCHVNYEEESLACVHAEVNIGCVDCHGASYPHRNDENNTTPPDMMYPADGIDRSCQKCHATHDVPAAEVIALWLRRRPTKTNPETIVCTDCHGDHRLKLRTVRWDKKTGKLIRGGDSGKEKQPETGTR